MSLRAAQARELNLMSTLEKKNVLVLCYKFLLKKIQDPVLMFAHWLTT